MNNIHSSMTLQYLRTNTALMWLEFILIYSSAYHCILPKRSKKDQNFSAFSHIYVRWIGGPIWTFMCLFLSSNHYWWQQFLVLIFLQLSHISFLAIWLPFSFPSTNICDASYLTELLKWSWTNRKVVLPVGFKSVI